MDKITINGKDYKLKNIDFNAVCELEDLGMSIVDIKNKTFKSIRALVALVIDSDLNTASKEIEAHIKNKGKFDDFKPLFDMVANSDFFRNLSQQQ